MCNKFKHLIPSFIAAALLASCSDHEPQGGKQPQAGAYRLSGTVEKGPFVRGSSISVQPLNASLGSIGTVFNGEIADDAGTFDLGQIELESQFVRITTDGYYFNEVTGTLSAGTLHLVALADLSDRSSVNVNILTHLKSARIQKLMQAGSTFAEANKQAQKELLTQFGLQAFETTPAESMSITAGTDGSGVLIAISSIILADRTDAEITQYLSMLSQDLADDGTFTEANMKTVSQGKNRVTQDLDKLARNITDRYAELGMDVTIPDLRYFFDWNDDGIAGNEVNDDVQISLSQNEVNFGKEGGTATITVTSNIELSLEQPNAPDNEPGQVNQSGIFFIDKGSPLKCETSFENNVLTIKVDQTEKRTGQYTFVSLYDMMGNCQATIRVTLAGDPNIKLELSENGVGITNYIYANFAEGISWMFYVERGYTGMYKFYDVKCPLDPNDYYNRKAFAAAHQSIADASVCAGLIEEDYDGIGAPFFHLLNAIVYTEMVDKWGNIGLVSDQSREMDMTPSQQPAEVTLRYLSGKLDEIADAFPERKADGAYVSADNAINNTSRDVWRMAKANICMALGQYAPAQTYLQQIVDGNRYSVTSGNEYDSNDGTILQLNVPDEVMPGHTIGYYTYADVLLLLAECHMAAGNEPKATPLIRQVANAKGITLSGNNLEDIDSLRKQLFMPRYFAFQKRNNLGGYEMYQRLWPIPYDQIMLSSGWTQNPGY